VSSYRLRASAACLAAFAVPCVSPGLAAQTPDTILGTHLLANPTLRPPFRNAVRIVLSKRGQYRVGIWPATTRINVSLAADADRSAFVVLTDSGRQSAPAIYEIYPQGDGPELITLTPVAGTPLVRLWFWEDTTAEVASRKRHERHVGLGVSAEAGEVSGYRINEPARASASRYVEGGIVIGSNLPISLLLGAGNDPRTAGIVSVNWVFAELRARLWTTTFGGRGFSLLGTARAAQGDGTTSAIDPLALGGGAMVTWHLDHKHGIRGWTLGARASWYHLGNLGADHQSITRFGVSLAWVP
jgi:hypothetical protein